MKLNKDKYNPTMDKAIAWTTILYGLETSKHHWLQVGFAHPYSLKYQDSFYGNTD